ncbi:hypothetical protein PACILC2_44120 [Paenibacillus cisolokensis]|uniref:Glycoside hydrolase family 38 N-terminal domain-containing protein n=1 Tax=Paenibacillus cisolokensis TaxID=1658519 RepID=A0ABQ4NC99_9BACL|nr:hypothetical protein PACILC2_44120 [Paenibacillus cisolokensis]
MKDKKLYMIGNAHLDPVWLWQWQEGFQEAKATFRSALDRMKESEDFIFTSSSAAMYEWIENNDPAMFEEIRQRVREGRWHIVGGWWIQPDCNIPGGESFVRQGLYGQRYFKEKLGVTAKVGYNVDSFGHHGMLPQILKKAAWIITFSCVRCRTRRDCRDGCSGGNPTTARGCSPSASCSSICPGARSWTIMSGGRSASFASR